MIEFIDVTKEYDSNIGLEDVNIKIDDGEFVFLVGASGAGKTTFIKLIMKEIEADEGTIAVNGRDITNLSNRMIPMHRREIGMVFQDFRLLPKKTVYENVALAMEVVHATKRSIGRTVPQLLDIVGIADKADKYPNELSAGEQQRVAIARAIANNPRILICDEPTGNLDPINAWSIMKILDQINKRGTTVVMVTHAWDLVNKFKKRVITIESGRVVKDAIGAYTVTRDELYDAFRGQEAEEKFGPAGKNSFEKKASAGKNTEEKNSFEKQASAGKNTEEKNSFEKQASAGEGPEEKNSFENQAPAEMDVFENESARDTKAITKMSNTGSFEMKELFEDQIDEEVKLAFENAEMGVDPGDTFDEKIPENVQMELADIEESIDPETGISFEEAMKSLGGDYNA